MSAPRFPNVQRLLADVLEQFAGSQRTGSKTPDDLQDRRFIRIVRIGGPSDRFNDYARVEIDSFAPTYSESEQMAQDVHQHMIGGGLRSGAAVVDRVGVDQAPVELPWAPGVCRHGAAYLVVCRRYTPAD